MLEYIESFLYQVALGLSYPVFIGLALLILWSVYCTGDFFREWLNRRSARPNPVKAFQNQFSEQIAEVLSDPEKADIRLTRLIRIWEKQRIDRLDRVRFMVKIAPSMGLIGTLIPMGIALSSLSTGDLTNMSSKMVNAFTATIAGLAASVVAYLISLACEKWLKVDFLEVESHYEEVLRDLEKAQKSNRSTPIEA